MKYFSDPVKQRYETSPVKGKMGDLSPPQTPCRGRRWRATRSRFLWSAGAGVWTHFGENLDLPVGRLFSGKTNRTGGRATANRGCGGTGIWLEPKHWYFLAKTSRVFARAVDKSCQRGKSWRLDLRQNGANQHHLRRDGSNKQHTCCSTRELVKEARIASFCSSQEKFHTFVLRCVGNISEAP